MNQDNIPTESIKPSFPTWAKYIAQDPDGSWWAYEAEPHIHDNGWYENEIGRVTKFKSELPNAQWASTLRKVPFY